MKITFIGTSHGVPSAQRYCACTMVEVGGALYLIDIGAPVTDILPRMGCDISKIRAVFTTHSHGDHTNGMPSLVDLVNWHYRDASIDICVAEQCYADAILLYANTVVADGVDTQRLRFHVMDSKFIFEDGNIRLKAIPTMHMASVNRPSYAFLLEAEGKRVLFSGDLSHMLRDQDFPEIVTEEDLDVFICEMGHFGKEQIAPYLEKCKAKAVYFNHVYPTMLDDVTWLEGRYPFPVYLPSDGDEIILR